jgi:uncharacterized phage protein (TIGR01671 family)
MREIKFRAWDKNSKTLYYSYNVGLSGGNMDLLDFQYNIQIQGKDLTLMQYTGLKDKNGVEIYEGDIVRIKSVGGIFNDVVEWQGSGLKLKNTTRLHSQLEDYENIEVIGNRFENPELLKESER